MPTSTTTGTITIAEIEGVEVGAGLDPGLAQGAGLTSHPGLRGPAPGLGLIQDRNRGPPRDPRSHNLHNTGAQEKVHQIMMSVKKKVKRIKMLEKQRRKLTFC